MEGIFDASPKFSVVVLCQICQEKISEREIDVREFYPGGTDPYAMGEGEAEKFFDHLKNEHDIAGRAS